jgi:hemerythrin
MEQWAAQPLYRGTVQYLCVCVDNEEVAKDFGRMFKVRNVLNAFIPRREFMPVGYGQLGCSGFVIVDGQGCFVARKTKAFLTYGDDAFHDVDRILNELHTKFFTEDMRSMKQKTPQESYIYSVGNIVMVDTSYDHPELVGKKVRILGYDKTTSRYRAELCNESRQIVQVLPCCLCPIYPNTVQGDMKTNTTPSSETRHDALDGSISRSRKIHTIAYPATVGVECMDDEHKSCVDAINAMLLAINVTEDTGPTPALLRRVLGELEHHFEHEEALMKEHIDDKQGGANSNFSALASHVSDHANILEVIRNELARFSNDTTTCSSGMCGQKYVNPHVAFNIARLFVDHAERFDSLYSTHIPRYCT